ncbi:unnamed protein product [Bursaphelenchus okinawaensis]|uniref:G-protein coupled receptors family 1 profile domain-containing protein n=1 Tax=Bursaphelenchus okinawaensis TaxID=465554 RepID=A0A811KFH9_9BILA|nr:unnamed protein product [Bursaphelenchus okinawaensis]CAG9102847.1 unnamed protein product [Bursaphelenchus okinawaensis]
MKDYRRFIVNFTLFDLLFTFTLGTLVKPDTIFPFQGCYINGWLRYFGHYGANVAIVLIIISGSLAIAMQAICLVYRFSVLQGNHKAMEFILSWKTWTVTYVCLVCSYTLAAVLVFSKMNLTEEEIKQEITRLAPELDAPLPDFTKVIMYLPPTNSVTLQGGIFIMVNFLIMEMVSLVCVIFLLKKLEKMKQAFSTVTYRLHRELTVALGMQVE